MNPEPTRREKQSDAYFRANLDALLTASYAWRLFKRKEERDFADPASLNSPTQRDSRDHFRLLALEVLALAKRQAPGWSASETARFWCELAQVDHRAYQEACQPLCRERLAAWA